MVTAFLAAEKHPKTSIIGNKPKSIQNTSKEKHKTNTIQTKTSRQSQTVPGLGTIWNALHDVERMDVATRSDQAVATIEEGLRLDEKEGAVPDGTGWHWDVQMERHGKTWKDYKRISLFLFIPIRARTHTRYTRRCMHF